MRRKILGVSFSAACLTLAVIACNDGSTTVSGPTPVSTPVASSIPAPAATPAPVPVVPPTSGSSFELTGGSNSTIYVKYTGEASFAGVDTFYTSFDDQETEFGKQSHTIKSGDTLERSFGIVCIQGDADQPGVKMIGGIFFDINGNPFNPSRNPEKVKECRDRCVPEWREAEPEYGDWEDYEAETNDDTQDSKCYKTQRRRVVVREVQSCTNETRIKSDTYETRQVEVQCRCIETGPRDVPGQAVWSPTILQGRCEQEVEALTYTPQLNCHQNGTQEIVEDYVCREDSKRTRNLCRNVACPTPEANCDNTAAYFKGNHNNGLFNLPNSGEATEEAKANSIVGIGPWELFDKDDNADGNQDGCTTADHSAKVVFVKAGNENSIEYSYITYLNVTAGSQICSYDPPGSDKRKGISHVSYFRCDD